MHVLEGVVTVVQEGRFLLTGDDGVTHLIVLSHASWAEPDQLPGLQRQQVRVRVRCEKATDMVAYVARSVELSPHGNSAAQV